MIERIDRIVNPEIRAKAIKRCKEKGIILPTFAQQRDPGLIPAEIREKLKAVGLWDLDPLNLFRITWKNEPVGKGGGFGKVNYIEIPKEISGVNARILMMLGKYFPTGAHKVGAAFGCLAPRLISGQFDPEVHKAVWPSTGNYCRGGAFDSHLMGCTAVAILPEEMSNERFEWLREIGAEVIATPGCESNVKEIYDKCWELRRTKPDYLILNQFDEFGNPAWHYNVTGPAAEEVFSYIKSPMNQLSGFVSNTGSAGTIAAGDYLRTIHPGIKVVASEALQCPTLLLNGFGGHRIEGIGDKHVPWIHNVKNTDVVTAIDDEDCMRILRLFNEEDGIKYMVSHGIERAFALQLQQIGISGIANLLGAIKLSRYFEYTAEDVIVTIATDSVDMYRSRLVELNRERGSYSNIQAAVDMEKCLLGTTTDNMKELRYTDKKAIHNLKYYTWVEQQGKSTEDLNQLWYDKDVWPSMFNQAQRWDEMIEEFNR